MSRPETTTDALVLPTAAAWRAWLEEHADTSSGVWLAVRRRRGATLGVDFRAAVEHALCLGWIDGQARSDERGSYQRFTPRRPGSTWSAVNRARVARLTAEGRMAARGLAVVEDARRTGAWDRLAEAQAGVVPRRPGGPAGRRQAAGRHFRGLPALVAAADPGVGGRRPPSGDPRAPHRRGRRLRRPGERARRPPRPARARPAPRPPPPSGRRRPARGRPRLSSRRRRRRRPAGRTPRRARRRRRPRSCGPGRRRGRRAGSTA